MKVSIFGLGYVGCVTAGCLAKDGHGIIGVDVVASKVARLSAGLATIVEPGLEVLLAEAHRLGRLSATTDARAAVLATDASVICVGTPTGGDGSLDLTAVHHAAQAIGEALRGKSGRHVVILRSTVMPGTMETLVWPILLTRSGRPRQDVGLLVIPEFLREGSAIADYNDPPFVVVGSASGEPAANAEVVHALFGRFADRLHWITFREAELLKPVCNAFHALKVAFANEVGSLCSSLGINGQALMRLVAADRKLNISPAYLRPGLPFGGSCLPKDLRMVVQLADSEKMKVPLLRGVLASNETHKERLLDALPVNGYRRLGLEGLAFKPGTDDLRDSPLVPLAYRLISKGYEVKIFDPAMAALRRMGMRHYYLEQHHPLLANHLVESAEELLGHAELLVLTQERGELRTKVRQLANPPHIVDLTVTGPGADRRSPSDSRDEMRQRPAA